MEEQRVEYLTNAGTPLRGTGFRYVIEVRTVEGRTLRSLRRPVTRDQFRYRVMAVPRYSDRVSRHQTEDVSRWLSNRADAEAAGKRAVARAMKRRSHQPRLAP